MRALVLSAVPVAMMLSAPLTAQVTPVAPPTIVPIVGQQTSLSTTAPTQLIQRNVNLTQGQMVRVFTREEFTSNVGTTQGTIDYVDVWLECLDPNGNLAPGTQDTGQNFVAGRGLGPNYPTAGHMVLTPSTLITAGSTGTYSCRLVSGSDKPGWVVGRHYQGANTTWLGLSAPIEPHDAFSWVSGCDWQGPYAGSDGCLYLGTGPGSHGAPYEDVFSTLVIVPPAVPGPWSPTPGAAFVDVTATLQVTLCGHTSSCVQEFKSNDTSSVTVDSYLELDQLDAGGKPFHTTVSPTQETTIDNLTHHDMIFHKLSTVPVYPSSNPPQFQVKLIVTWVSGSTAKIDEAQAVAFTSFHGHAQFVPNVVGLAESVASNTLITSGYAPGVLTNVLNSAPPGSVISQDPPGGSVIGSPGSGVNLTVSARRVSVPNVSGVAQTKAVGDITASGLIPQVSLTHACTDPGNVIIESPLGGTVVAAGSTVKITVDSAQKGTCAVK